MKFRNISGGPLSLPTLGIGNVEPGEEFEATNEPAQWLATEGTHLVERTDKPDSGKSETKAGKIGSEGEAK